MPATGPGSIGVQLQAFVYVSPLAPLVRAFALPAPVAIGALIAMAEIAVGIGTLTGLVYRAAAFGGLVLATLFWLTASWATSPFYYGADLPFAFGWLAVFLAGDAGVSIAGTVDRLAPPPSATPTPVGQVLSRRDAIRFALQGLVVAVATAAVGGTAWLVTGGPSRTPARRTPPPTPIPTASTGAGSASPGAIATGPSSSATALQVAVVGDVKPHQAVAITDPTTGDPAFLFRLASGQIVAYDGLCTHEGCAVDFEASSELFVCPCHDAVFDPAHGARVLSGPTQEPLPELALTIDPITGAITIAG